MIRGRVADGCRSWTPRERKTVSKVSYSMIVSIPAVFSLLNGLTKDPVLEVGLKCPAMFWGITLGHRLGQSWNLT